MCFTYFYSIFFSGCMISFYFIIIHIYSPNILYIT
nr:MAG TPA_asm: hypothetical protein [Caudoviricetes sp.]DAV63815.1 MAG TPA: hypothetical protein [Caudoviricetes sp.]